MKLYEIPRGSKIRLLISGKGDDGDCSSYEICTFNNLDGAYSNITTEEGKTVHLSASAPLIDKGDYYELEPEGAEVGHE